MRKNDVTQKRSMERGMTRRDELDISRVQSEINSRCDDLFTKDMTTVQTRALNFSRRTVAKADVSDMFILSPPLMNSLCSEDSQAQNESLSEDDSDFDLFEEAAQRVASIADEIIARHSQDLQHSIESLSQSSQRHDDAIGRIQSNIRHLNSIIGERERMRRETPH